MCGCEIVASPKCLKSRKCGVLLFTSEHVEVLHALFCEAPEICGKGVIGRCA